MFSYTDKYHRSNFINFFKNILPIEEQTQNFKVTNDKLLKSVTKIANVKFKSIIPFFEVEHFSKNDPRVELTNNLFNILNKFSIEKALVVFFCEDSNKYRFSFIESSLVWVNEINVKRKFSHPKRLSFLLGENTKVHTPYNQFKNKILDYDDLKKRFDKEVVTEEFFQNYKRLYLDLIEELEKDKNFLRFSKTINLSIDIFARKLMGQIIFCYFLQKKGWLGATIDKNLENGDVNFFKNKFDECTSKNENFYNNYLEPLFYEGLNQENNDFICKSLNCKIPYLNGGLFEQIKNYDWKRETIKIDNFKFSNPEKKGILDIFDLYNFTVDESTDFDVEIAIDPEMLGKVFESLIPEHLKKTHGVFYTHRSVVNFMCRESLTSYLFSNLNYKIPKKDFLALFFIANETEYLNFSNLPISIKKYSHLINYKLGQISVCDPAAGSGAFPIAMMIEISKARYLLQEKKIRKRPILYFKKFFIENSLYAIDIDPGSIEVAKLRLWLSLIVDEKKYNKDLILPNLDFKIIESNSLKTHQIDLFNIIEFNHLAELKSNFFNEINKKKQYLIKNEIDKIISKFKNENKFDFKIIFFEKFNSSNSKNYGFDIVIGNPPYVGSKKAGDEFKEIREGDLDSFYMRLMDYFYFFFHQALNILKSNGIGCYITTNYYITATQGKLLRNDLKNRSKILSLVNFNELKIFQSAKGQHNLITTFTKNKNYRQNCKTILTSRTGDANDTILDELFYGNNSLDQKKEIEINFLYEGDENYIRLDGKIQNDGSIENIILNKIIKDSQKLVNYFDVGIGLQTSLDKITKSHLIKYNFLKPEDLNRGIYVLDYHEVNRLKLNQEETKIVKKIYKNSDIHKYFTNEATDKFLLYLTRDLNIENFPNIKKHIYSFKKIIETRSTNRGEIQAALKLGKWWVVYSAKSSKTFEGEKIVCPQRSKINKFGYQNGSFYANNDVNYIRNKTSNNLNLRFLTAILNSKLFYFWLKKKGKVKGESLELCYTPLCEIPIKLFEELDRNYLANCLKNIEEDKNIKNINFNDEQINNKINELYKLTPKEINYLNNFYPKENE